MMSSMRRRRSDAGETRGDLENEYLTPVFETDPASKRDLTAILARSNTVP